MKYHTELARRAQKEYCETANVPHFAPATGDCPNCKRNIYEPHIRGMVIKWITGITVSRAKSLIAACPHCSRSFI